MERTRIQWLGYLCAAGFIAAALAGCAAAPATPVNRSYSSPLTHTVQSGETIYRIAERYRVDPGALMRANGIYDPRRLRVGQVLMIPGAHGVALGRADSTGPGPNRPPAPPHSFSWPIVDGVVSSGYGIRHGVMHDGVDIAAPVGTPVHAADAGVVAYVGHLRGYGNVVIIEHRNGFVTVYGHDAVNQVQVGERVARGQVIGEVGTSGHTTGPNLHFEVRHDNLAYNPLRFLPAPGPPAAVTFAGGGC
ncbi:MAG TPA: M23 family metallopeptidase [Candidatus Binataceae bacterium]|nr:M23 family metallopeptidase [Candidatus Binataceae bacterium]